MRVLIVSAFPPETSPEANHALHISEHLADSGGTVHVLCRKGSIAATRDNIVLNPVIDDWSWSDLPKVKRCIRECRPDVVLLLYLGWIYHHEPMISFLPTICKTVLPGVPCVTQFECVDMYAPSRSFLANAMRKAMALGVGGKDVHWLFGTLLRDSARIIALSTPHRTRLLNHYAGVEEKSVILPPPPLIRFCTDPPAVARKQARQTLGARPDDFLWVYWGYIYPGKGIETLLQAFRIVCRRNEDMRLILVGGGLETPKYSSSDYFQRVRQLAETLGIADRVTWTGHFDWDSEDGSRYLHAGDACILPFDSGLTLSSSSLAAASTHGLPVVSTEPSAGRDEMLDHGRNIYLCRPRDPEMLAEAIELVSEDADLREHLRDGARKLAQDWYRWETTIERLAGVLESACSAGKERSLGPSQQVSSLVTPGENPQDNGADPLVSVIVPVHNVEKYVSQCLDSLVNQTLKNIEIILINDASTDHTPHIIHNYKTRYPNLRIVNCESNLGTASARNIGLRVAKGQYIAFTDADDWADIRMCEVMWQRAIEENADMVIINATVFYEDSKTFGPLFDQGVRQILDPRLGTMSFDLRSDPRLLLLESVNWTKLYKRSFLQKHALYFEEGMNSYEDILFHFSVLTKATRISLVEDALYFYRKNRPGQVTARTDRKNFETFHVFDKIRENLAAWGATSDIWAMLVKVQVRIFGWLLEDRVQAAHKQEFLTSVAQRFRMIPEGGFRSFARQAGVDEVTKLFCMRRNWLYGYEQVARRRWPLFPLLSLLLQKRWRGALKRGPQYGWAGVDNALRVTHDRLAELARVQSLALQSSAPLVETCRIHNNRLFLSRPSNSNLGDAIWRMQHDYYLMQTGVFRERDTFVDVGAHVGVMSIYLAKTFPFITVYAVEPNPQNFACLVRNITLNGVTNIVAMNKAVSGDGRPKTLYIDAGDTTWATIDARMIAPPRVLRTAPVESLTLEHLFTHYGIQHCRLLKITAPGAVHDILQSFTRSGCVDLLCGEADLEYCSRVKLEAASWRIARQHFWRTTDQRTKPAVRSWIHQAPTGIERIPHKAYSSICTIDLETASIISNTKSFDEQVKRGSGMT